MRPLFTLLLVCASVTPALADNLFTQTRIKVQGTIVDDGGQKYSLTVGAAYTAKALVQNISVANLHNKWASRVGQEAKTASQLVFGNISEPANTTNSAVYAAVFGEGDAPYLSSYTHQRKTGTVVEISTGVYQFTSDSVTYNLVFAGGSLMLAEANTVLPDAATSGDPVTVGGYYCYRGDAAGSHDKFFVVEDFVE